MNVIFQRTSEQEKAIKSQGSVIVKAGPGTGKTMTLIGRIYFLLNDLKINPEEILVLTFTQKAAQEIKERLNIESEKSAITVGTFHSFALEVLLDEGLKIKLASEALRQKIIKEIILEERLKTTARSFAENVSNFKNFNSNSSNLNKDILLYQSKLERDDLKDFDDLLSIFHTKLKEDLKLKNKLQSRFGHILIDEFQDTNILQYEILKQVINSRSHLFVIGDPNQSIYEFRGADAQVFSRLKDDYSEIEDIRLTKNFRSCQDIVQVSNRLFPKSPLNPNQTDRGKVMLIETLNEYTESEWIVNLITTSIGGLDLNQAVSNDKEVNFSDFAILYRNHNLSKILVQKLKESGIPFQRIGESSLYEKKEVSFIICVLKFLNHQVMDNFYLILENDFLNLDYKILHKVKDFNGKKIWLDMKSNISSEKGFTEIVLKLEELIKSFKDGVGLQQLVLSICDKFQIKNESTNLDIEQFLSILIQFGNDNYSIDKFIHFISWLNENNFYDKKSNKVVLSTIHSAKGLEFKYVVVMGFEDNLIPIIKGGSIKEEKRLLYVAMTRAKNELYLTYTRIRNKRKTKISQFKNIIKGEGIVEMVDKSLERRIKAKEKWKLRNSQLKFF